MQANSGDGSRREAKFDCREGLSCCTKHGRPLLLHKTRATIALRRLRSHRLTTPGRGGLMKRVDQLPHKDEASFVLDPHFVNAFNLPIEVLRPRDRCFVSFHRVQFCVFICLSRVDHDLPGKIRCSGCFPDIRHLCSWIDACLALAAGLFCLSFAESRTRRARAAHATNTNTLAFYERDARASRTHNDFELHM